MEIEKKLLDKYNVALPRYTSYPPANYFDSRFNGEDYTELLDRSNHQDPANIAFYIHIPFCKKICFYCGCNACAIKSGDMTIPYLEALKKEMEIVATRIDSGRKVSQVHYGGGTPNSLDASLLKEFNEYLFSHFDFIDEPEIAIECNPAYLDEAYILTLVHAGFNRFSLGIQDFNNDILKTVNREPSAIPVSELIQIIKKLKPESSVNLDFIYGLPGQTADGFEKTINEAIHAHPDRIVTFSYAHVPWMKKHQSVLEKTGLPDPEEKTKMFLAGYNTLLRNGYKSIGMDHYVLPEDELYKALTEKKLHRNFQGYCTRRTTGQVYAFGVSAISQLGSGYSQNTKDLKTYVNSLEQGELPVEKGYRLTREQIMIREVINEIMCNKQLDWEWLSERCETDIAALKQVVKYPSGKMERFAKDGLLTRSEKKILVTEKGSFFIRNIAASFDPYLIQKENMHSKTV